MHFPKTFGNPIILYVYVFVAEIFPCPFLCPWLWWFFIFRSDQSKSQPSLVLWSLIPIRVDGEVFTAYQLLANLQGPLPGQYNWQQGWEASEFHLETFLPTQPSGSQIRHICAITDLQPRVKQVDTGIVINRRTNGHYSHTTVSTMPVRTWALTLWISRILT